MAAPGGHLLTPLVVTCLVTWVRGTLYPGLYHGDYEKQYIGIVHSFTTYPNGKANKLCEYSGKVLLHPTNRCRYLLCQYVHTSDPSLYGVEKECPLGTHVPTQLYISAPIKGHLLTGTLPQDQYISQPCVTTDDFNCPKDTPLVIGRRTGGPT